MGNVAISGTLNCQYGRGVLQVASREVYGFGGSSISSPMLRWLRGMGGGGGEA